jgi:hypothetical protein
MFKPGTERVMDGSVFTRERPVFVAADNRRARRLRFGGGAAGLIACLWVAALAVGMLGTGRLPGFSLPSGVRGAEHDVRERAPAKAKPSSERSRVAVAKQPTARLEPRVAARSEPVRRPARARRSPATPARRTVPLPTRNVAEPAPPADAAEAPPVTQPAPTPAPPPPKQGWASQGYAAPPGETRRIEAQQPAAPPAPAQPQPAPAPPGQQKKAEDPNPKG